jgi:hypothetical protein
MADDKTGYSVSGESLKRIGRAVRAVETNQPIPFEEKRRSGFNGPMVEGVFLEDLPGTSDPNTPSYARFQIQTALQGLDGWAKENSPSIIPVWNRSPSSASEGDFGFAKELYPNKWYWVAGGTGASTIRFAIREADCENRSAIVKVLSRAGSVPGEYEIAGQEELNEQGATVASKFVVVYDKAGCYLNESNLNLFGRIGYANYLYGTPLHPYDPWWSFEVTAICEQQTECEAF